MPATANPSSHPSGDVLVIASPSLRGEITEILIKQGFRGTQAEEPYAAMAEICRRPLVYRVVVISLQGLYQEELNIISAIKRRFPHIEIYLAHTDGRQSALAQAMRLGADGLVSAQGLHRMAAQAGASAGAAKQNHEPGLNLESGGPANHSEARRSEAPPSIQMAHNTSFSSEPVLSADELRALLQDEPMFPPVQGGDL